MTYNEIQNLLAKIIADIELAEAEVSAIDAQELLEKAEKLVREAKNKDFQD